MAVGELLLAVLFLGGQTSSCNDWTPNNTGKLQKHGIAESHENYWIRDPSVCSRSAVLSLLTSGISNIQTFPHPIQTRIFLYASTSTRTTHSTYLQNTLATGTVVLSLHR